MSRAGKTAKPGSVYRRRNQSLPKHHTHPQQEGLSTPCPLCTNMTDRGQPEMIRCSGLRDHCVPGGECRLRHGGTAWLGELGLTHSVHGTLCSSLSPAALKDLWGLLRRMCYISILSHEPEPPHYLKCQDLRMPPSDSAVFPTAFSATQALGLRTFLLVPGMRRTEV